jgi:tRNA-splicing endonuclease subunit Sen2
MSVAVTRATRPEPAYSGQKRAPAGKFQIYAHPLPLPPSLASYLAGLLPSLPADAYVSRPIRGIWDAPSRTVWVINEEDVMLLWRKGFYGKGSLSRSEPSWLTREKNKRSGKRGELRYCPQWNTYS